MCCGANVKGFNDLIELIRAFTPLVEAAMPVLLLLVGWWIKKQNQKATDQQTKELKAHSDENRVKITDSVVAATGDHKILPEPPSGV
jgi:hypothetical protein